MTKFDIGQAVRRVEDKGFLAGSGEFVDLTLPRQCFGFAVLSPRTHAQIVSVDLSEAEAEPRVLYVSSDKGADTDKIGALPRHFMPVPRAIHIPDVQSALEQIPAKTNPLGSKGIGESGTIGAPPTIVNAALDALRNVGGMRSATPHPAPRTPG